MARKTKKTSFQNVKRGCTWVGGVLVQAGKEYSSIPTYAVRELTGEPHHPRVKCKLKRGWFE